MVLPISQSLSLDQPRGFGLQKVLNWLDNLVPDGDRRARIAQQIGVQPNDIEGILAAIGGDTAGHLTFLSNRGVPGCYQLTPHEFEEVISDLEHRPLPSDSCSILAGAMEKICVRVVDDHLVLPINGLTSTHILKPEVPDRLWGIVHNEALCMTLARRLGLDVASATTGNFGQRAYLLVKRFDRKEVGVGPHKFDFRTHQEDFLQALGRPPWGRYQVTLEELLSVAADLPEKDYLAVWDAVIVNVLLCNNDAHAKNFAILMPLLTDEGQPTDEIRLAPLYDLVCTEVYPKASRKMAMSIAGQSRGDHIYGRYWRREADIHLVEIAEEYWGDRGIIYRVEELASKAIDLLPEVRAEVEAMPAGPHPILDQIVSKIERRCRRVLVNLKQ